MQFESPLALLLMAAACNSASAPLQPIVRASGAGSNAPAPVLDQDSDRDGLCDATEAALGTNPQRSDTDGDGFPDALESIAGFDPADPTSPEADQVGYLIAGPGATLSFDVRTTALGDGSGATGSFVSRNSFDPRGLRASDFFANGMAVSAEPPDNARDLQASEERFGTLLGTTRVAFRLLFQDSGSDVSRCAAALPFEYRIKSDSGHFIGGRDYLLVVTIIDTKLGPDDYCRPVTCL